MKRYLPLLLSAIITAALAGLVAWRQQIRIAGLRDRVASRTIPAAAAGPATPVVKSIPPARYAPTDLASVLSRTKSRSMLRTGQELVHYYQTCPLTELREALEDLARSARVSSLEAAGGFIIAMSALVERDTAAAVEIAGKLRDDIGTVATIIILNDWISRDKKAALAWFHGLKSQKVKGTTLTAANIFFGASNPQLLEEIRNGVSDEGVLDKSANQALEVLAKADPEAALARLNEVAEPEQRRDIERDALLALAGKDPQKALGMMMLNAAPEERKISDADAARVLVHFTSVDKQAADRWMTAQSPALIRRLFTAEPSLGTGTPKTR